MSDAVTAIAPAKLNLFLHITGRRDDGYHLLQSLMCPIDLHDKITIKQAANFDLKITGDFGNIGASDDNLVTKAVNLLAKTYKIQPNLHISLEKNIPHGAGLGGASSDVASTLLLLNELWQLGLGQDELCELGLQLGADVPFFIMGQAALVSGVGEVVEPVDLRGGVGAVRNEAESVEGRNEFLSGRKGFFLTPSSYSCQDSGATMHESEEGVKENPFLPSQNPFLAPKNPFLPSSPDLLPHPILLVFPATGLATPQVYQQYRNINPDFTELKPISAITNALAKASTLPEFLSHTHNDLEKPATMLLALISQVITELNASEGCTLARMSGSGSCCFGIFSDNDTAQVAMENIKQKHPDWWVRVVLIDAK